VHGGAGVSKDSLTVLVRAESEERGKAAFDKFKQMISCVHGCFTYFNKLMPQLAKEEAHREFHKPA